VNRKYVVFATVSVALLMASIDSTIVATALPTLGNEMRAPINWSGWTISAYLFGQTIAMPIVGKISDAWGRRRVFTVCTVLFTTASVLCGLSVNIYWLIAFRFVQALGGGGFMPSAVGIVSDTFGKDRDRAIGLFVSVFPVGALIGPAVGGFILSVTSWRAIFFINVPIGLLLLILIGLFVRADALPERLRLDVVGSATLAGFLFFLMLALTLLGDRSVTLVSTGFLLLVLLSFACGVVFVMRESRAARPLIALTLLRSRPFAVVNGLNVIFGGCAFGMSALVPLFAQETYAMTPLEAGSLLSARAIAMIVFAALASWMLRRTRLRPPIAFGFVTLAVGLLLMAVPPVVVGAYPWLFFTSLLTGTGVGLAGPAANNAALQLQPESAAAISGLRGMFRQMGAIATISVATLFLARSGSGGTEFGHMFIGLAVLLLLVTPAVLAVPESDAGPAVALPAQATAEAGLL
jgi:EmrB/QacA subfamily drug resistance transporter